MSPFINQYQQSKPNRKVKILVLLIVLLMAIVSVSFFVSLVTKDKSISTAQKFVSYIDTGDHGGAYSLLVEPKNTEKECTVNFSEPINNKYILTECVFSQVSNTEPAKVNVTCPDVVEAREKLYLQLEFSSEKKDIISSYVIR